MMQEMMQECCGDDGKPDFEKMKAFMMKSFMEKCGKTQFTEDDFKMMRQLCDQPGKPDFAQMKKFMENCGC